MFSKIFFAASPKKLKTQAIFSKKQPSISRALFIAQEKPFF